ncbi:uncharacterized protein VTP21DRAFT_9558 [Calcarisporiella thermophila]|uniref:uncharacterized protein n=1 Tax=Calcarisporiella thermophila TaxID=911321 RepID=UPI003743C560
MSKEDAKEFKVAFPADNSSPLPPSQLQQQKRSAWVDASLPIFCQCAASILMTVTNKYVVSGTDFNMNFFLLAVQSIVTVFLLELFKRVSLIQYRPYSHEEAKSWFPVTALLVAMIYTGSKALQYFPIPIYTIFKNITIILIAYGEVVWFGGKVTQLMLASFGLMVLSSVIAGWSDVAEMLSQNIVRIDLLAGYLWMYANCFSTAAFVLYMRKRIKLTNFKDFDTAFYNNLLSIPLLVVLTLIFEDWSEEGLARNFPEESKNWLYIAMILSGTTAFAISYTSAWCVRVTSSTTYSMVGALNKLPVAVSGMVFFGDPVTVQSVSAVSVGFTAGVVYVVAQEQKKRAEKSQLPLTEKEDK